MTISGYSFTRAAAVDFRTDHGDESDILNDTTIADGPSGTGVVNVTVTALVRRPSHRRMSSPRPRRGRAGVQPDQRSAAGGTLVTITGTSFTGDGGRLQVVAATNPTVVNDTTITADSPAGTGTVDGGDDACGRRRPADPVAPYIAAAVGLGLAAPAGGTPVTITGTRFTRCRQSASVDGGDGYQRGQRPRRSRRTARREPAPST